MKTHSLKMKDDLKMLEPGSEYALRFSSRKKDK
jgi:hypothetical protein